MTKLQGVEEGSKVGASQIGEGVSVFAVALGSVGSVEGSRAILDHVRGTRMYVRAKSLTMYSQIGVLPSYHLA